MAIEFGDETEDAKDLPPGEHAHPVSRVALRVVAGPCKGTELVSEAERCTIGSLEGNDLLLADRTVSRFHCELVLDGPSVRVRDLDSHNGTRVDGVQVVEAFVRDRSTLGIGDSAVEVRLLETAPLRLSEATRFGNLVGASVRMRALFAALERAAATDSTVLALGETGTGKEEVALAIHEASARASGPFVVLDCASMPANLVESELFGHERGAFTGAVAARAGAFEAAHGGTLFIDELGELELPAQSRLLRAIETRAVRRVGTHVERPFDVRIVAATHRDLRSLVNAGRFREDLYYRLAVIVVRVPPLRERPEDVPLLARELWRRLGEPPETLGDDVIEGLVRAAWPGNVRELRNWLEHYRVLRAPPALRDEDAPGWLDGALTYDEARDRAVAEFERRWLALLLARHDDNVSEAARAARVSRAYLHRLLRRHGLR